MRPAWDATTNGAEAREPGVARLNGPCGARSMLVLSFGESGNHNYAHAGTDPRLRDFEFDKGGRTNKPPPPSWSTTMSWL